MHELSKVHQDWLGILDFEKMVHLLRQFSKPIAPESKDVFNVFETPPSDVRVVIIGQDPYPTVGDATGLAFSVNRSEKLPKSLQNIFKELASDIGQPIRKSGDLRDWKSQGVFLINRVLTVEIGKANSHAGFGWERFTEDAIKFLGSRGSVGLLMGKSAAQMSKYFANSIEVAHPSPLSAHRGFTGSKPFSRVNALLEKPIVWG